MGVGFSNPDDIPHYLSCMDIYVCPSVQETYGISVVQAMAMELPVIHYGIAGIQVGSAHLAVQPRACCKRPAHD